MDIYSHWPWRGEGGVEALMRTIHEDVGPIIAHFIIIITPTTSISDLRTSNLFSLWVDYGQVRHNQLTQLPSDFFLSHSFTLDSALLS